MKPSKILGKYRLSTNEPVNFLYNIGLKMLITSC